MRYSFFLGLCSVFLSTAAIASKINPLWTIKSDLKNPESAYYDSFSNSIFVSNVAGEADSKDGEGWISQVSVDGKIIASRWFSGLNAPKGLRSQAHLLWVTDIDEVITIDLKTAKLVSRMKIQGAKFLNDIAIDAEGSVYVSDTLQSRVYRIKDKTVSIFRDGPFNESPNGLLIDGNTLWMGTWGLTSDFSTKVPGRLVKTNISEDKVTLSPNVLTKAPFGNLDGLERRANGNFLVSDWMNGKIYQILKSGKIELLMQDEQGAADIGYIENSKVLLVPQMKRSELMAFRLE